VKSFQKYVPMQPEKDEVELTYFGGLRMKTQYTMFLSRELNLPAYKKNYGIFPLKPSEGCTQLRITEATALVP